MESIYYVCWDCNPPQNLSTPDWKNHFPEVHGETWDERRIRLYEGLPEHFKALALHPLEEDKLVAQALQDWETNNNEAL